MKKNRNEGGFSIFPESDSFFDKLVSERARWIIMNTAEELPRPTRKNLAEALGIEPTRLSRDMEKLGLTEKYKILRLKKGIGKKKIRSKVYREMMGLEEDFIAS